MRISVGWGGRMLIPQAASSAPRGGSLDFGRIAGAAAIASLASVAAALLLLKSVGMALAAFAAGLFLAFLVIAPPFWLALLLVALMPFNSLISQWLGGVESNARQAFTLWKEVLLAVGIVRSAYGNPNLRRIVAANRWVLIWCAALLLAYLAAFLTAPSIPGIFAISLDTKLIVVMLFFMFLELDRERMVVLMRVMVGSVALIAVYGLFQHEWDYERLIPLVYSPVHLYAEDIGRLYSYSLTPLEPAFLCEIAILILFSGACRLRLRAALPLLALLIPSLLLTYTRSAYTGLALGVGTVWLADRPRRARYAAGVAIALAIICAAFLFGGAAIQRSNLADRFASIVIQSDLSSTIHKERMARAVDVISKHPFGIGLGEYGTVQARFAADESEIDYSENQVLQVVLETGFVGGVFFVVLTGAVFWALLAAHRARAENARRLEVCALAVFVGLNLSAMVMPVWEELVVLVYAWALVGSVLSRRRPGAGSADAGALQAAAEPKAAW